MERFQNNVSKGIITERNYPSRRSKTELLPIKRALELKAILFFNKMVIGFLDFTVWVHIFVESPIKYSLKRDAKVTFEQKFYRTELCLSNFFNRATECAIFIQRHTTLDVMNDASIFRHNLKKFSLRILLKLKIVNLIFLLMLVIYLVHNV